MRITCPNCTANFEIPSELLGRKGRSLKCANCGHSWYQTPQVESIDLAEIMGEEYAARARADMGAPPRGSSAAQRQQGQQQRAYPPPNAPGMPQQRGPQAPPGAVSLMRGGPAAVPPSRPPAQGWGNQNRVQQVTPPWTQQAPLPGAMPVGAANPGWYQQQPPPGAMPPGQAPAWYQQQQQPRPAMEVGGQNPAWYPQQAPGAAPMPVGTPPPWYQPDAAGQPGGYPPPGYAQQSMMPGQAPGPAQGQAPVSWMQNPGQALAAQHQGPMLQNVINLAPQRGATAAPLPGSSMIGPDGQPVPGEAAVSWLQNPGQQVRGGPMPSMPHQLPGGPGMPGMSQMGPAGVPAPGQAARSLMDGTIQAPGMGAQSLLSGQQIAAPGLGAQSMISGQQIAAPGQGAQSMLTGEQIAAPGQAAVSLMDGTIQAPGEAARSMLDGTIQAPGEAAVSMLDGTVQEAQAGQSMLQAEQPGVRPDGGVMTPEEAARAAAEEGGKAKTDPTLVTDEKKGDDKEPLWTSAKEDEELVDPDADRPDFGGTEEAAEEATEEGEEEEESAITAAAARAAAGIKYERKKPMDPAYVTAGLMAFALIAAGTVMWTQRAALTRWWPGFAALYEKTGLAPKNPGDGLRLAQSGTRLVRIGGVETLVVKGYISNISTTARNVPGLRLQLVDAKNEVVQEVTGAAPKSSLDPGASVDYELKLELPDMGKAKNVIVSWN